MGFNIDRLTGKYKIDGHYVGKATYNLVLTTAQELEKKLADCDLDEIMNTWKILVDGSNEDVEMEHLMAFNGLFEYAESYLKDAVGKFLFARSYQYVVEKRLKEEVQKMK